MDAYNAKEDLRDLLGEDEAEHFTDRFLLRCLNRTQQRIYMMLSMTRGDWFLKSQAITFSSNVATLPSDCAKPAFLRDTTRNVKIPITLNARQKDAQTPWPYVEGYSTTTNQAFLYGDSIEVNYTLNGSLDLWYDQKNIDLHLGTAAAGDAASLTLCADYPRSYNDDYYNGLKLNAISGTGSGVLVTVQDYDGATGVLTLGSGTFDSDTVYGLASNLPAESYDYWLAAAAFMAACKPGSSVDPDVFNLLRADLRDAKDMFEDWASTRIKDNQYMARN